MMDTPNPGVHKSDTITRVSPVVNYLCVSVPRLYNLKLYSG